jgi:hypothetical protein
MSGYAVADTGGTHRRAVKPCPICQCPCDSSTQLAGESSRAPVVGDLTLCVNCGALLVFDGPALALRVANTWEVAVELRPVVALAQSYIAQRGRIR